MSSIAASSSPPSRILFVLDHFYPYVGGAETLFWELSRALVAQGHAVNVVTLRDPGTSRRECLDGVHIERVWVPRFLARYLFILAALPRVFRRARRADVIHAGVYASAFPAWLCGWLLRKPTLLSVYEVFGDQWGRLVDISRWAGYGFRAYEWMVLHLPFTRFVCISQFTSQRLQQFAGVSPQRISVVYPAVDYEFWDSARHTPCDVRSLLGVAAHTFIYLFFGRPGVSKGVDNLVAAAKLVAAERPASRLVLLLGKEPEEGRRRIVDQIRQSDLVDHVAVLDPVPRSALPGWLLAADCVVVPSLSEGFGYSAVEAASLGCRVVATAGHAVAEVLGAVAELVPAQDPPALARAILAAAAEPKGPRPAPRTYTLQAHLAASIEVYRQVLSARLPLVSRRLRMEA